MQLPLLSGCNCGAVRFFLITHRSWFLIVIATTVGNSPVRHVPPQFCT